MGLVHFVDESEEAGTSTLEGVEKGSEDSDAELQEEPLADATFDVEALRNLTNVSTPRHSVITSSLESHHLLYSPSSVVIAESWNANSPAPQPGLWPVSTKEEAELIRYFSTELSSWVSSSLVSRLISDSFDQRV